jgi:hypothetical protein
MGTYSEEPVDYPDEAPERTRRKNIAELVGNDSYQ